jgi:protein required for attachment to host cells
MPTTWILATDRAKARLVSFDAAIGSIQEIGSFVNPGARAHRAAQHPLPRTHDRMGDSRHAIEPRTSASDKADDAFARELDAVLERGRVDHRYRDLVLVAPPRFLGVLHATLGDKVRASIVAGLPKDITSADKRDIVAHLHEEGMVDVGARALARLELQR